MATVHIIVTTVKKTATLRCSAVRVRLCPHARLHYATVTSIGLSHPGSHKGREEHGDGVATRRKVLEVLKSPQWHGSQTHAGDP